MNFFPVTRFEVLLKTISYCVNDILNEAESIWYIEMFLREISNLTLLLPVGIYAADIRQNCFYCVNRLNFKLVLSKLDWYIDLISITEYSLLYIFTRYILCSSLRSCHSLQSIFFWYNSFTSRTRLISVL